MAEEPHEKPPLLWTTVPPHGRGEDEAAVRRKVQNFEFSQEGAFLLAVTEILNRELGFERTLRTGDCVLGDGRPIPMMSYALVEYLLSLDLSALTVLELGGGQSTLFWAAKARSVHTLEHDGNWLARLSREGPPNLRTVEVRQDRYVEAIEAIDGAFDIIVLDCAANRYECAKVLGPRLREGGMIILDNSDWHPNTAAILRGLDLIQVDFPDFRPSHHFRCTTSLFLHPAFRPAAAGPRLPPTPMGGKDIAPVNRWDEPERR